MVQGCLVAMRAPSVQGLPLEGTLRFQYMRGEARGGWAEFDVAELSLLLNPVPNQHPILSAGARWHHLISGPPSSCADAQSINRYCES